MTPKEIAATASNVGVTKAHAKFATTLVLAILAGAFIALGAAFATTATAGAASVLPFGITRLVAGLVFALGLILVVVAGAELFTGNSLMAVAWAERRISLRDILRNWSIVYVGNLIGAVATAGLLYVGKVFTFGEGAVGQTAMTIANAKAGLVFSQAVALGIMCNALVCLAVWMAFGAKSTTDKIVAVIFPVAAFVAMGFEHSIANMYFLTMGMFVHGGTGAAGFANLTWGNVILANLIPVTIGNIIGGALMVGLVYWFAYRRGENDA